MIPRFRTQYEQPSTSQAQTDSIFNNLVDIEINRMGAVPTSTEIKDVVFRVEALAQKTGVRSDIASKRISSLIKDHEVAAKKESEFQSFSSVMTRIDNRLKNPAYLKSPISYFQTKSDLLNAYSTSLSNQLDAAIYDKEFEKAAQLESWTADISAMRFQNLTAMRNVVTNPNAAILIADIDPYSESIYGGRYVTPEEYQNKYQTVYYKLDGAKSETGTQIAVNKNNLRKNQITLGNTTWEVPMTEGMSSSDKLWAMSQSGQSGQSGQSDYIASILGQQIDTPRNTLVKSKPSDVISTIPIHIYDVVKPGQYAVSSDNQAIYKRDNIDSPLTKIKVPNASAMLDELEKFYVRPFNQDMEDSWNVESKDNIIELPDVSTSSVSSSLTPQQQQPQPTTPTTIRGGRGVTGTPQQPDSNVWKTAGSIFKGMFPQSGIFGLNR